MTDSISRILGNKAAAAASFKPLTEALTEDDLVNMIMGVAGGDLRKGLKVLKKSQLKKIYAAVTGQPDTQPEAGQPGDAAADPDAETEGSEGSEGSDDSDDAPTPQNAKQRGGQPVFAADGRRLGGPNYVTPVHPPHSDDSDKPAMLSFASARAYPAKTAGAGYRRPVRLDW